MKKPTKLTSILLTLLLALTLTVSSVQAKGIDRLKEIEAVLNTIDAYYLEEVDMDKLIDGALKGIFDTLDKYSTYYTAQEFEDLNSSLSGDFSGVGMYIEKKGDYITVISPIEGSPAHEAGIIAGDKIAEVDGIKVKGQDLTKVQSLILGEPGTKVNLGILRGNSKDLIYFEITRAKISINPVSYRILEDNIGYIKISDMNSHVVENFEKATNYFKDNKVEKLVLDLRDNPGGYLDQAIYLAQRLVPRGPVLRIYNRRGLKQTHYSYLAKAPFEITVLVNEYTASAAEIVAVAIQDSGAGKVIGTTTFGKGIIQYLIDSEEGAGFKLTVEEYRSPKGNKIHGIGVIPDIEVENTLPDHINIEELVELVPIRDIQRNTMGYDVYALQQRLKHMGYMTNAPTGLYSKMTEVALQAFCKDNGLEWQGIITPSFQLEVERAFIKYLNSSIVDSQLEKALEMLK